MLRGKTTARLTMKISFVCVKKIQTSYIYIYILPGIKNLFDFDFFLFSDESSVSQSTKNTVNNDKEIPASFKGILVHNSKVTFIFVTAMR